MIVAVVAISAFVAWRSGRKDQVQLQARLDSAEQALRDAEARQESRKTELARQLSDIKRKKDAVRSPQEVLKGLPEVLPLPKPLALEETVQAAGTGSAEASGKPDSPSPQVRMPIEDLKPLYDAALECQACQAELEAAQADLADEKVKTQAVSGERDDALQVARGGSVVRRILRAAKWFAIGAAAGAVSAKMAH